jgi:hypothetical protein
MKCISSKNVNQISNSSISPNERKSSLTRQIGNDLWFKKIVIMSLFDTSNNESLRYAEYTQCHCSRLLKVKSVAQKHCRINDPIILWPTFIAPVNYVNDAFSITFNFIAIIFQICWIKYNHWVDWVIAIETTLKIWKQYFLDWNFSWKTK